MTLLSRTRSFCRSLFSRDRFERDMADEWRFHLDARIDALVAGGISAEDASRQARIEFGDPLRWREQSREARGLHVFRDARLDVRHAVRQLRHTPGFTALALFMFAFGIGANAAVFSVVDPLLLRSLPVRDPDRLVFVHSSGSLHVEDFSAPPAYALYASERSVFEDVIADAGLVDVSATYQGERSTASANIVSANYFTALGVRARLGRLFVREDDAARQPVVVLSDAYWTRAFHGDPAAVGKQLVLNDRAFTIAGIAPAGFSGITVGTAPDVYVSLTSSIGNTTGGWIKVVGRLREGVTPAQAVAALGPTFRQVVAASALPQVEVGQDMAQLLVTPAGRGVSDVRDHFGEPAWVLSAVVFLILLVASANVATLMFARTMARRHEIAVRLALGATRSRILRQFGVEVGLIAVLGALAGSIAAQSGSRGLVLWLSAGGTPVSLATGFNSRVFIFIMASLTLAVALACIGPAWALVRFAGASSLKSVEFSTKHGTRTSRVRHVLVVGQIAASLVLLVGTGLLTRSLVNLYSVDVGFSANRVLAVSFLDSSARRPAGQADNVIADILSRARNLPGVARASVAAVAPFAGLQIGINVVPADSPDAPPTHAELSGVTPDYFDTLGIGLVAGRGCSVADSPASPPIVIINRQLAHDVFGSAEPLSRQIQFVEGKRLLRVVGVVANSVQNSVRDYPIDFLYMCRQQTRALTVRGTLFVRSAGPDAGILAPAIQRLLQDGDPGIRVSSAQTLGDSVRASLRPDRIAAGLFSGFTLLALCIATVGIYGVVSSSVAERTREFGVRMAIGASAENIVTLVLGQSLMWAAAGIALGVAAAAALTRYLGSMLFGVTPLDAPTFIGVSLAFGLVAALASFVPARRATRVDPLIALRCE